MLGNQIDAAADRTAARDTGAAGRHAVEQRARPLQHLDALNEISSRGIIWSDSVQTIQPIVAAVIVEAANEETIRTTARRLNDPDGGIVGENVTDRTCLLVLYQLRRIACLIERRVHHTAIAEKTETAAGRDLATCIGRRDGADRAGRRYDIGNGRGLARSRRGDGSLSPRCTRRLGSLNRLPCSRRGCIDGHRRQVRLRKRLLKVTRRFQRQREIAHRSKRKRTHNFPGREFTRHSCTPIPLQVPALPNIRGCSEKGWRTRSYLRLHDKAVAIGRSLPTSNDAAQSLNVSIFKPF